MQRAKRKAQSAKLFALERVVGLWSLVFGLWSLVFGLWSLVFGLWSLVATNQFVATIIKVGDGPWGIAIKTAVSK